LTPSLHYIDMQPITTKLTKLLGVQSPIILPPMAFAATDKLILAITSAGGFAFLPAAFYSSADLKSSLQSIRRELRLPGNVSGVPVGVGFLGWILDNTELSDDPRILPVLDELPAAVWFAFGNDLGKYIAQVHEHDAKRAHKTIIFVIVNSVADAQHAANEWKVDVLVVQGFEAGGHGGAMAPPLSSLLQAVLTAIPNGPVVIAAGGVSTGAQIAGLLTQGAAGVVLGTRFLFTSECQYSSAMKEVLVSSDLNATQRSLAFDEAATKSVPTKWPEGIDGRAIANDIYKDYQDGLLLEERIEGYEQCKAKGEKNRLVIWAGVGAGMTTEIKNATDVFNELHEDTIKSLGAASRLC